MKRLDFIKKIGLATVGLPLLSSFELSKEHLFVADQEEREKFDFELYEIVKSQKNGKYEFPNGNIIWVMEYDEQEKIYYKIELINEYPYYTSYKEYYRNGYLKSSEKK